MAYEIGDVVLVPFPYTDLSDSRVRPAVVVTSGRMNEFGDVTVAMVTSRVRFGATDWGLRDWMEAGLRVPSWVRARFVTLDQTMVRFSPGHLTARDIDAVKARLRSAFELT